MYVMLTVVLPQEWRIVKHAWCNLNVSITVLVRHVMPGIILITTRKHVFLLGVLLHLKVRVVQRASLNSSVFRMQHVRVVILDSIMLWKQTSVERLVAKLARVQVVRHVQIKRIEYLRHHVESAIQDTFWMIWSVFHMAVFPSLKMIVDLV
jgi:hypothetical protein